LIASAPRRQLHAGNGRLDELGGRAWIDILADLTLGLGLGETPLECGQQSLAAHTYQSRDLGVGLAELASRANSHTAGPPAIVGCHCQQHRFDPL
jgi:hypothetical protein